MESNELEKEIQSLKESLVELSSTLRGNKDQEIYRQIKEKRIKDEASKILSKSMMLGPDIYKKIYYTNHLSIPLRIPETLLYISNERKHVYMFNDSNGLVRVDSSEEAISNFFAQEPSHPKPNLPKYIHFVMNGKIEICNSSEEARKVYSQCPYYEHRLQKYICPSSSHISKTRVSISNLKKMYILTSTSSLDSPNFSAWHVQFSSLLNTNLVVSSQRIQSLEQSIANLTSFMKKTMVNVQDIVADFMRDDKHEWVLLKCVGYKLKGKSQSEEKLKQNSASIKTRENSRSLTKKLSTVSDLKKIKVYQREQKRMQEQVRIDNRKKEIDSIMNGLKFRASQLAIPKQIKIPPRQDYYIELRSGYEDGRIPRNIIGIAPNIDNRILTKIESRHKHTVHSKSQFNDMVWVKRDIKSQLDYSYNQIQNASSMFDQHYFTGKKSKEQLENIKKLSKFMNQMHEDVRQVCRDFFKKVLHDKILSHYFEGRTIKDIDLLSHRLIRGFTEMPYKLSSSISNSHKILNISSEDFTHFCNLFERTCRKAEFEDDEINLLIDRLKRFEKDIVNE